MFIQILNPQTKDIPWKIKRNLINATLTIRGITITDQELDDIYQALEVEKDLTIKEGIGIVGKYGHLIKGLKL